MALDSYLNPPYVALVASDSVNPNPLITVPADGANYRFGSVYQINPNNLTLDVGTNVLFDSSRARQITQLTQTYFLIDEADVILMEISPP